MLYIVNNSRGCVYEVDTNTATVVDTIYFGDPPFGTMLLGISPDGSILYVYIPEHHAFYEIDTRTKEIKYTGSNSSVYISPDGKYLFTSRCGSSGKKGICVIDACTHQYLCYDTTYEIGPFGSLTFDRKSPRVYGILDLGGVGVFNYQTFSWERTFEIVSSEYEGIKLGLSALILSPDGKTLYFTGGFSSIGTFGVYDLTEDSLVFEYHVLLAPEHSLFQLAYLAISPDGRYVYVTDPGGYQLWPPYPEGEIWVFDTQDYTFSFISTDTIVPPGLAGSMATCDIEVTPDGKKAYVSDWWYTIVVINLETNNIIDTIQVEKGGYKATYLAIQTRP